MIKRALEKLNENQIRYCKMMSYIINSARDKNARFEYERYTGKLRGYLECLMELNYISGFEIRGLYSWFLEKNRYNNSDEEWIE